MPSSNYPIIKHYDIKKQLAPQFKLNTREILFVDQGIEDHQILIDSVRCEVAVHLLDSRYDGVSQLLEILKHYTNLDAVHIVSHGNAGCLILGNSTLSSLTFNQYQHDLFAIQNSLNQNADILLYGCNVGKGASGQYLIQQLAVLTGANVAASSHRVGNPEHGGHWILDVVTSAVAAECVFRQDAIKQFKSTLVTNTLDFTNDTVSNFVTATHPTTDFGTINLKIVNDANSTGTANGSLTLAATGSVNDTFNDFFYGGGSDGEYLVIYTDGREVDFQSIKFGSSNSSSYTSLTAYAYRDNVLLGSQTFSPIGANYPNNTSDTETVTFTDNIFDNADEIRLIGVDGVNQDVVNALIDDVVIADAVAAGPTVTSATYDASTNTLVVTGTNMSATGGATNDINVSKLTLTGQGGASYTLTSSNVEIDSATQFTVALNATDRVNIEGLLNNNGATAVDSTTYNIAAAADWNPAQAGNADLTGNLITASNVQSPTVTSATYDAATGNLVVTGTNLVAATGATNDITANKFTLTGEGGETYTLTDSSNVEITSDSSFTVTLSATDKAAINQIINKDGTSSTSGTTYNLSAVDDWNTVIGNTDISDATNVITVSNVAIPTITSATYDFSANTLTVTGTGFLKNTGATNDIDISQFTFTGEGSATYTLTSASDVEITSGTSFSVSLSGTDLINVEALLNNNGTTSATSGTTYNLAAADNWAAGADAAVNVADTVNSITVSNYTVPTITSATYDASTGQLVLTGTGFVNLTGAANDIDVSLFTFTGEGGSTYTLTDTSDAEVTSATAATIVLSATDRLNINGILNNNGTTSALSGTTYNLAAAEDWMAGAPAANAIADAISAITVSNVTAPTITSTTYDASAGSLVVTGTNLVKATGVNNDITVNKLTFTGEGGATYTLTDSSNVEITSDSSFTVTLSATDKAAINQIINKDGTSSTNGTTYNLSAVDDWNTVIGNTDISDATNAIIVSNVATPTITSSTYDTGTGVLAVTGTGLLKLAGANNDIDASLFTVTGLAGGTYTLTDTTDVDITSGTQFMLTLSATDKAGVNALLDTNGVAASDTTTYNLAAAEDWAAGADAAVNVVDATGNGITVDGPVSTITSSAYDANTGALIVTGTDFVNAVGAANDVIANKFTFTGEGGTTYTLTDTADVDITSATAFTLTLSATDKTAINQIVNKDGASSTDGSIYNLAAAEDWAAGENAAVNVADLTANPITVSNVAAPTITAATYNTGTGTLAVTGVNLLKASGAGNDIIANKFTLTGEGGATYTLTDTANVDITSATAFTLTLSAVDKAAVNLLVNKNGTASNDATTYNLAAAEDWATGADTAVNVVDAIGNAITATVAPPNGGGGGGSNGSNNTDDSNGNSGSNDNNTPPPDTTLPSTKTFDGVTIDTQTETDGTTTLAIPVVESTRIDDPNTVSKTHADIPVLTNLSGGTILTVSLPTGVGLSANGQSTPMNVQDAVNDLVERITQQTTTNNSTLLEITAQGQRLLSLLASDEQVSVQTILPTVGSDTAPDLPLIISGSNLSDDGKLALIVDMSNMPPGTAIQLDNVAFAAIIGAVRVTGGAGENFVVGDDQDQFIVLGPNDDILFGGGGNDTVGSLGGNDQTTGDAGNDIVYGGAGHDVLTGGSGNDILNGGLGFDTAEQAGKLSDYQIAVNGNRIVLNRDNDETDTLTEVELIRFETGPSLAIAYSITEAVAHHLVKTWLGRELTVTEGNAVQNWIGATSDDIVTAFLNLPEAAAFNNQSTDELLAGLNENPNVIQVNTTRTVVGSDQNDQGYLTQGLGFLVDGGNGHDVLRMRGNRDDVYLEQVDNTVEITRLDDGAMLSLTNAEMIAFDSGETQLLAHNRVEGILGRLVQTFFDRDATINEWQMGRDALNHGVSPDVILNWFQARADLNTLDVIDYIQALYNQTYGRAATETELNQQLLRLDNGEVTREWLAVDIASSDEAITTVGSVWVVDGSV